MSHTANRDLQTKIDFLKQVTLFGDLPEADLARLVGDFRSRSYRSGAVIVRQGDNSHNLYVVLEGQVRIYKNSLNGDETSIAIFKEGDVFGEFSAVDNRPRSATARALKKTVLLEMTQDTFLKRLETMPALSTGLIRLLIDKVRWTAAYAETIAQYDAAGRLMHILLAYNERFGTPQPDGSSLLDLPLNQAELASLVGAKRGWVNRILKDWRKRGLVEHKDGQVTILDLAAAKAERDNRIEGNQAGRGW